MIVNMYRYSFMVFHDDYATFLDKLRDAGVLHIKEREHEPSADMQELMRLKAEVSRVAMQLEAQQDSDEKQSAIALTKEGEELMDDIKMTQSRLEQLDIQIDACQRDLDAYKIWGSDKLSSDAILRLQSAGIEVKLYKCSKSQLSEEWTEQYATEVVTEIGGMCYFVAFGFADMPMANINVEEVVLPERSCEELHTLLSGYKAEVEQLREKMTSYELFAPEALRRYESQITDTLQYMMVHQNTDDVVEGKVKILEGYVPEDSTSELDKWLEQESVVYMKEETTAEEEPPIKLRNSWFSKLFEPITEMFSLPNYGELDPTPLFAPFFMLFFGLCLGDAGYGMLVLIAALIAKKKLGEKMRGYCNLGVVLGLATIVVSLMTGMVFGIDLSDPAYGVPESIRSLFIADRNFTIAGYSPMMVIAVILGLVQILFGMCVNAAKITKQSGGKYAISTICWVLILPIMAITWGLPAIGIEYSPIIGYVLYAVIALCVVGILFYNSPDSSLIGNLGSGLWTTYNMATGLLGDTLSYIRLFALGLTGGILGGVFNSMAMQAGDGLPWYAKFIVMLLILLVGHAINIGLCLIGAFVHPMRLTFVEFYKNAGFEGGGKEYNPFRNSEIK